MKLKQRFLIFLRILKGYSLKLIRMPLVNLGFVNINTHFIKGPKNRLQLNGRVGLSNTLFNTRSGNISVGHRVLFGHNCMVLTGKHNFEGAATGDLSKIEEVAESGRDIKIGDATWIASGSILLGGVEIGKHCIVMAGAVVTKNIPDYSVVAGIPGKVVRSLSSVKE